MRKFLLFTAFLLSVLCTYAQDVIVMKDGRTIVSRVEKITTSEVTYKKYSNLKGPSYTIGIKEIKAINYENGTSDTFDNKQTSTPAAASQPSNESRASQSATATEKRDVLIHETASGYSDDTNLRKMYYDMNDFSGYEKKAKKLKIVGWTVGSALSALGIFACVYGGSSYVDDVAIPTVTVGALLLAGGIGTIAGCLIKSNQYMKKARRMVTSAPIWQHHFYSGNGTNLAIGVNTIHSVYTNDRTLGFGLDFNF